MIKEERRRPFSRTVSERGMLSCSREHRPTGLEKRESEHATKICSVQKDQKGKIVVDVPVVSGCHFFFKPSNRTRI